MSLISAEALNWIYFFIKILQKFAGIVSHQSKTGYTAILTLEIPRISNVSTPLSIIKTTAQTYIVCAPHFRHVFALVSIY